MAKIKVRRTNREELPGIAVLRDAAAAGLVAYPASQGKLDLDMVVDPILSHLIAHDPDGFFTAMDRDETLGFAAAHVRSRQFVLSELWVLPQHRGKGAGEALLARVLTYGERSGARGYLAIVPAENAVQSLLLRHDFEPVTPIYMLRISTPDAAELGSALSKLLPGRDATAELLSRRGQADLDRIDRFSRDINRELDHPFWLKTRGHKAAFVSRGDRVVAYAYGGVDAVGPVAGTSQEAALGGLGWALSLGARSSRSSHLHVYVPAAFRPALEATLEAGARLHATMMLYGRDAVVASDRWIPAGPSLP
jgi:GNAT superfamily N-acetyltransferase